jgi:N-acetylmuramic acid 6-phosphate etherase
MVSVKAASSKLQRRAEAILMELAGCTEQEAADALEAVGYDLPVAIVIARAGVDHTTARRCLEQSGGDIHAAMRDARERGAGVAR